MRTITGQPVVIPGHYLAGIAPVGVFNVMI